MQPQPQPQTKDSRRVPRRREPRRRPVRRAARLPTAKDGAAAARLRPAILRLRGAARAGRKLPERGTSTELRRAKAQVRGALRKCRRASQARKWCSKAELTLASSALLRRPNLTRQVACNKPLT